MFSNFTLTYLSTCLVWKELAPSLQLRHCKGCQGFIGPYPSAFLDKYIKELECKDIRGVVNLPKNIFY